MSELNFEVIESPIYYSDLKIENSDYKGVMRSDNSELLSIMKSSYKPLCVRDFKEIVNKLQKSSGFEFSGYQEWNGGRTIIGYLKNTKELKQVAGFPMQDYMTVVSSFDGTASTSIGSSNLMIRCMNSFSRISKTNKFKHTISAESKLQDFLLSINNYFEETRKMYEEFNVWNNKQITADTVKLAIEKMVSLEEEENSVRKVNKANDIKNCMQIEIDALGTSLFSIFNGFTRYSSHNIDEKRRTFLNPVGSGANFNNKAYGIIKELEHSL